VPRRVDGEGWLLAERVGVVVVVTFPGVVVAVEYEVPGKEKHGRSDLAVGAHPAAAELHGQLSADGEYGRVVFVSSVYNPTGRARVHVVLRKAKKQHFYKPISTKPFQSI